MTTADLLSSVRPRRLFARPASLAGHIQIGAAVVVLALMATLVASQTDAWRVGTAVIPESDLTQFEGAAELAFTASAGMRTMADDMIALRLQSQSPASSAIDQQLRDWTLQLDELTAFLRDQRAGAAAALVADAQENLASVDRTLNSVTWQPAFLDSSASLLNQTAASLDDLKAEVLRLESIERAVAARTLETASDNAVGQLGLRVVAFAGTGLAVALAVVALGFGVAQATANSNSMEPSPVSVRSASVARTLFKRKLGSAVQSGLIAARRTVMAVLVRLTMI